MYRCVFIVGIALIRGSNFDSANALTDYSYVNINAGVSRTDFIIRCFTGLGPTGTDNGVLGGLYFNDSMIPNGLRCTTSDIIQVEPGTANAGISNMFQCAPFTTDNEGIYTCVMMNSSMMNESMRFGLYFSARSELLYLYVTV